MDVKESIPSAGGARLRAAAVLLALACGAGDAAAIEPGPSNFPFTPLQLALLPNVQLPQGWPVFGVRFDLIHGRQDRVVGLDLGVFNEVAGQVTGLGAGILHNGQGSVRAMLIGVANVHEGSVTGFEVGLVNQTLGDLHGAQLGIASFADNGAGLQMGGVNSVSEFSGVQIGAFLNRAKELRGVQIGLINLNPNGFLPIFPLINFGF